MDQLSLLLSSSTFLPCPGQPGSFLPLTLYSSCQQHPYAFYIFTAIVNATLKPAFLVEYDFCIVF